MCQEEFQRNVASLQDVNDPAIGSGHWKSNGIAGRGDTPLRLCVAERSLRYSYCSTGFDAVQVISSTDASAVQAVSIIP